MATEVDKPVSFSPEQLASIFGEDHDCTPGETYTVTFTAGDKSDDGFQSFTAEPQDSEEDDGTMDPPSDSSLHMEDDPDDGEDSDTASPLGYSRKKLTAARKKSPFGAPKATDLTY